MMMSTPNRKTSMSTKKSPERRTSKKVSIRLLSAWLRVFAGFAVIVYMNCCVSLHLRLWNPPPEDAQAFPPIYWINLDRSKDRAVAMTAQFHQFGVSDTHRVPAVDINRTEALYHRGDRLLFHPDVSLEARDGEPTHKKHYRGVYEYQEAACLLSHLHAVLQAYEDGAEQALILEDDALLSTEFMNQWGSYVEKAPADWKILQFATNNINVVQQGVHLLDLYTAWQPYHWSTRAYLINREGMEALLTKIHSYASNGDSVWSITDDPMVVADEVIYHVTGDTYTSTRLWIDASASFGSTIQSEEKTHSTIDSVLDTSTALIPIPTERYSESLLILMNARIRSMEELQKEVQWIRQDNTVVCPLHQTCIWEIRVALTESRLLPHFEQATLGLPNNIHFHTEVNAKTFNKFSFLTKYTDAMATYDLILFKDNDQRIAGFPWRTFVDRKKQGQSVVAGPLRQYPRDALLLAHKIPKRQFYQFHAAEAWTEDWKTDWSSSLYASITPMDTPLLEMYFVLMDGKFASRFFTDILSKHFVGKGQTSSWGPDLLWCGAAKEWYPERPACQMIPVVSTHEDSRQIDKNTTLHKDKGRAAVNDFSKNEDFKRWMAAPLSWERLMGGKMLHEIESSCRGILRNTKDEPFSIQQCLERMSDPAFHSIEEACRQRTRGLDRKKKTKTCVQKGIEKLLRSEELAEQGIEQTVDNGEPVADADANEQSTSDQGQPEDNANEEEEETEAPQNKKKKKKKVRRRRKNKNTQGDEPADKQAKNGIDETVDNGEPSVADADANEQSTSDQDQREDGQEQVDDQQQQDHAKQSKEERKAERKKKQAEEAEAKKGRATYRERMRQKKKLREIKRKGGDPQQE